jgi:type VI protein secretion system component Hcp
MVTITVPGILDSAEIHGYQFDSRDVSITRGVDTASPTLRTACVDGSRVGDVTLRAEYTFVFVDAIVSAYELTDDATETVTFNYANMTIDPPP